MEILANYVDLDRLVSPEVEVEQLYPTKQNQKVVLTQVSLKTISLLPSIPPPQKHKEVPKKTLEVLVPQPQPLESISIFQNEKFQKLCALLEKGLEHKEVKEIVKEIPAPSPKRSRNELEDHILAERIRELSEDLRTSQQDLKEHQRVVEQLGNRYKSASSQLDAAKKKIGELQRQVAYTDSLKVVPADPERSCPLQVPIRETGQEDGNSEEGSPHV